jgi:hypothetical protein
MTDMTEQPEIIKKPDMGVLNYWRYIWRYREFFFFQACRD